MKKIIACLFGLMFCGTAFAALPSGYTEVEYIHIPSGGYIDTGVKYASENIREEIIADVAEPNLGMFGAQNKAGTNSAALIYSNSLYIGTNSDISTNKAIFTPGTKCTVIVEANNGQSILTACDGSVEERAFAGSVRSTYSWFIGGMNSVSISAQSVMDVYSVTLWDGGAVVRNMVPAIRTRDNAVGMYDTIGDKFYGNSGTGTFTAGGAVNTTSANPTVVIPATYTPLEYLQSSGTQYIDTGVTNENCTTYGVRTRYEYTATTANSLCGNYEAGSGKASFGQIFFSAGSSAVYSGTGNTPKVSISPIRINTDYTDEFTIDTSTGTITRTLNGTTITGTGLNFETRSDRHSLLFACNTNSGASQFGEEKIYYFQILKNGSLVRNLVPVRRVSDGALGMYDGVTGSFLTNAGTGTFIAGPAVVPDIYDQLQYIQSTGTQYIDTGINPLSNSGLQWETKLTPVAHTSQYGIVFGAENANTAAYRIMGPELLSTGKVGWGWSGGYGTTETSFTDGTEYTFYVKAVSGDYKITMNGTDIYSSDATNTYPDRSMYLFTDNRGDIPLLDGYANIKLNYLKVWNGAKTALIADLVPVRRKSDGELGMFDRVTGAFLTNAGTGRFIAGPMAGIQVATKKYNATSFNPVVELLSDAVTNIRSVVANTLAQADAVAKLHAGKQKRPTDSCPQYRQCLLVENEDGTPSWFPIFDPFRDFVTPILAAGTNGSSRTFSNGVPPTYTQLEYVESTGSQYVMMPAFPTASNINITVDLQHTSGTNEQIFLAPTAGIQYLYSVPHWRVWKNSGVAESITEDGYNRHLIEIKSTTSGVTYYVDGQEKTGGSRNLYNSSEFSGNTFALGARTTSQTTVDFFWRGKIYFFKATCDGVPCMDIIPVRRNSDNAIGMYDTVSGTFLPNRGNTPYNAGSNVANQQPTWAASWDANANNGIMAGTVYGVGKCNAYPIVDDTVTDAVLNSAEWNADGTYCWCNISGVSVGNANYDVSKNNWKAVSSGNCWARCGSYCSSYAQTSPPVRTILFKN